MRKKVRYGITRYDYNRTSHFSGYGEIDEENLYTEYQNKDGETVEHIYEVGYDQKFARGESLIFFVRNKDDIETPFVTLEYSPTQHKVLQCYADHDSKPDDNVLNFVNKIWLPYANRKIKKIA